LAHGRRLSLIWYPAATAVAVVLSLFIGSGDPLDPLFRPLLVAVLLTLAVQLLAGVVLQDFRAGAFVAFVLVLTLIGVEAVIIALLLATAPLVVNMVRRRRIGVVPWAALTRGLDIGSVILLALISASAAASGALTLVAAPPTATTTPAAPNLPDVFLILLDGYPRADTLRDEFGFDNRPWLAAMEELGLDLSSASRSNYTMTQLTLPSVLAFQHVLELEGVGPKGTPADQYRALQRALDNARGLDELDRAGYQVTSITSPLTSLHRAHVVIHGRQVSGFEVGLLHRPLLREALPELQRTWLADQYREALLEDFASLERLALPEVHPRFVLAHLFAPHAPLIFDAAGKPGQPAPCFPRDCQFWASGYGSPGFEDQFRGFLEWTNERTLAIVETIQRKAARPPVVIVFSDHGSRHVPSDRRESMASLFLASTPGHPRLFPDDTTPINIIPRVLNAYAGTSLPLETEESYWTDMTTVGTDGPLRLERAP
jgi:hypothetical protein